MVFKGGEKQDIEDALKYSQRSVGDLPNAIKIEIPAKIFEGLVQGQKLVDTTWFNITKPLTKEYQVTKGIINEISKYIKR